MRDPVMFAIASARHWLNKCYDLGFTAEEVVAYSKQDHIAFKHSAFKRKEKGREKETFPPHPLLEKKGSEEKAAAAAAARACGHTCAGTRTREVSQTPTWEEVEAYATDAEISLTFARAWYDRMNTENGGRKWRFPKTGKLLRNWCRYLSVCWKCRDEFNDDDPPPAKAAKVENQKLADFLKEYCA